MAIGTYIYHTVSQFSYSVVSDSLQPHGLQNARLPCPLLTPEVSHLFLSHPLLHLTPSPLNVLIHSVQFSRSVVTEFCNPMDSSMPGLPVHHQLPESTQTHIHGVSDAIQSCHHLSSPSPPAFNLSQHQGLFQ